MPRSFFRRLLVLVSAVITGVLVLTPPLAAEGAPTDPADPPPAVTTVPGRYIVTLADPPLASYAGGVAGIRATQPSNGKKVSVTSTEAKRYRAYLTREQDKVAARVGAKAGRRFSVSLNGFTAQLSTAQARELGRSPGVISVAKDTLRQPTDDRRSTDFLRLSGKSGVWAALGGTSKAGRGVVVGVIDTGIWPESQSFAAPALGTAPPTASNPHRPYRSGGKIVVNKSDGSSFTGTCQTGVQWAAADCNTKIVGARYFSAGWPAGTLSPGEFLSPRDGEGHGSHTASTAAGNADVPVQAGGHSFGKVSGVAPAASIAAYKVCWTAAPGGADGCVSSDLVAAIDAAVSDGVDVINYSIGGSSESPSDDPVQLAFLSAASAGIFVAASAGNSGPAASTLDNTSPWVTTVAASTIAPYEATVVLGNGSKYAGVSTTVHSQIGPAPLVNAAAVKLAAATADDARLCTPGTLDPAQVTGKIVVCDRGVVARIDKSAEVQRAGGVGMILVNLTDNSLDSDLHPVPTVHLNPPASDSVKAYAAVPGATASLQPDNLTASKLSYPQIAPFSSRGPSTTSNGDLLKPDIAAPGVGILAAVAPPFNRGNEFDFYSGTSMAAPHIAGLAALFFSPGVHPHWAPATIKSAMMTTAADTLTATGAPHADPFAQGAGEVTPKRMLNPGLVYKSGVRAWLRYLEGLGVNTGTGVRARDASDLNSPSIAVGELLASQTVTRQVTAVKPGLYWAQASVPGFTVKVTPSVLNFSAAQETKTFKVTFTRRSAAFDTAATGFLTWRGAGTTVRSPIAVTPTALAAPDLVAGTGASGEVRYSVQPGVAGPFPITGYGLAAGRATVGTITPGQETPVTTVLPAGAKAAEFAVRSPNAGADIDLYVYRVTDAGRVLVGIGGTSAANETVFLTAPEAGTYLSVLSGFANAPATTSTPYTFFDAVVGATPGDGNFTVSPTNPTARNGQAIPVTASWSGLDVATPYLGFVQYVDGSGTLVTVNQPR